MISYNKIALVALIGSVFVTAALLENVSCGPTGDPAVDPAKSSTDTPAAGQGPVKALMDLTSGVVSNIGARVPERLKNAYADVRSNGLSSLGQYVPFFGGHFGSTDNVEAPKQPEVEPATAEQEQEQETQVEDPEVQADQQEEGQAEEGQAEEQDDEQVEDPEAQADQQEEGQAEEQDDEQVGEPEAQAEQTAKAQAEPKDDAEEEAEGEEEVAEDEEEDKAEDGEQDDAEDQTEAEDQDDAEDDTQAEESKAPATTDEKDQ